MKIKEPFHEPFGVRELAWKGDGAYDAVSGGFYGGFPERPSLVAMCHTDQEVRDCLKWAVTTSTAFTVRGRGHSTAGFSSCDGLVIDVSGLNEIIVSVFGGVVHVGGGASLGELSKRLDATGMHVPLGACSGVGISGFFQGGGYGYTSRRYGMNCDSVIGATMLLADGRTVRCDRVALPDLFWAIRGGTGGNFGIVLELSYAAHRLEEVWGFAAEWDIKHAASALYELQRFLTGTGYRDLGFMCNLCVKDSLPKLLVQGVFCGGREHGLKVLGELKSWSKARLLVDASDLNYGELADLLDEKPYPVPAFPINWNHVLTVTKGGGYVEGLVSASAWRDLIEVFCATAGRYDTWIMEPYGGTIRAIDPFDCAFTHRTADFNFYVNVFDASGCSSMEEREARLARIVDPLRPSMTGRKYQNYPKRGEKDFAAQFFGGAYQGLQRVKRKYDPNNIFKFEQSISLSDELVL